MNALVLGGVFFFFYWCTRHLLLYLLLYTCPAAVLIHVTYVINTEMDARRADRCDLKMNEIVLYSLYGCAEEIRVKRDIQCVPLIKTLASPPSLTCFLSVSLRGFCYFNSVAIAAKQLQHKLSVSKILIVDWVR